MKTVGEKGALTLIKSKPSFKEGERMERKKSSIKMVRYKTYPRTLVKKD